MNKIIRIIFAIFVIAIGVFLIIKISEANYIQNECLEMTFDTTIPERKCPTGQILTSDCGFHCPNPEKINFSSNGIEFVTCSYICKACNSYCDGEWVGYHHICETVPKSCHPRSLEKIIPIP